MDQLAGNLDAIIAGQRGLEMLDLELAVTGREIGGEIADEIAAEAGLIDTDRELGVTKLGSVAQRLLGEQIQHFARRRPLPIAAAWSAEQGIEIDPAGLQRGIGLGYVASARARAGEQITIDVRGKPRRGRIVEKPIYKREERTSGGG
jgi:hypothetical protein